MSDETSRKVSRDSNRALKRSIDHELCRAIDRRLNRKLDRAIGEEVSQAIQPRVTQSPRLTMTQAFWLQVGFQRKLRLTADSSGCLFNRPCNQRTASATSGSERPASGGPPLSLALATSSRARDRIAPRLVFPMTAGQSLESTVRHRPFIIHHS